jgi:hypothetical protein
MATHRRHLQSGEAGEEPPALQAGDPGGLPVERRERRHGGRDRSQPHVPGRFPDRLRRHRRLLSSRFPGLLHGHEVLSERLPDLRDGRPVPPERLDHDHDDPKPCQ